MCIHYNITYTKLLITCNIYILYYIHEKNHEKDTEDWR